MYVIIMNLLGFTALAISIIGSVRYSRDNDDTFGLFLMLFGDCLGAILFPLSLPATIQVLGK